MHIPRHAAVRLALAGLFVAACCSPGTVHSADTPTNGEPDCSAATNVVKCFGVDLTIPSSPGLSIVGLSPDDAVTPATPRELGMALVNGTDREGRPKAGVALDFAPFKLLAPGTTREEYQRSLLTRWLWNSQLSIGTAKSTDASDKTQALGVGLRTRLWIDPKADPIQDDEHEACMTQALRVSPTPGVPQAAGAEAVATPPAVLKCYANQRQRAKVNANAVTLSVAGSRVSPEGSWSDARSGAQGVWLTGSYVLGHALSSWKTGQDVMLVATLRQLWREVVPHPTVADSTVSQRSTLLAVKLQHQSDKRAFHLEQSYLRTRPDGLEREHVRRTAFGSEWQIDKNVWVVVSFGGERGRVNDPSRSFMQTGLKFGTADSPSFGAGPR